MNDKEFGKKEEERDHLHFFLEEYHYVTGKKLFCLACGERPDFIVGDEKGSRYGLELTLVTDPQTRFWRRIFTGDEFINPFDTAIRLQELVHKKEEKRASVGWELPDSTILVLALYDAPIEFVEQFLEAEILEELKNKTGFMEIWVADFTKIEAFSTVRLMCLTGGHNAGLHDFHPASSKPFG